MAECTFCQPEELSSRILNDSSELIVSLLSNPRLAKGHSLVIPRRHIEPGTDALNDEEIVAIEHETERLRQCMLKLGFLGVDVFQKTRPAVLEGSGGTKMNHWHQHVIPSMPGGFMYDSGLPWGHKDAWRRLAGDEQAVMQEALGL